jgi:hypothetical protein
LTIAEIAANAKPYQKFHRPEAKNEMMVLRFNERGWLVNPGSYLTIPDQKSLASDTWEFI